MTSADQGLLDRLVFNWEPAGTCRDGVPKRGWDGEFSLFVQVELGLNLISATVFHFLEPIRIDDELTAERGSST